MSLSMKRVGLVLVAGLAVSVAVISPGTAQRTDAPTCTQETAVVAGEGVVQTAARIGVPTDVLKACNPWLFDIVLDPGDILRHPVPADTPPVTEPPTTEPPTTEPPVVTDPPTTEPPAPQGLAQWFEVQLGEGNLNGARRVAVVEPYPDAVGVCFFLNDVLNRCDATGPNENSAFHFFPIPTLSGGETLRAEWTADGVNFSAIYQVPDNPVIVDPPTTEPPVIEPPIEGAFVQSFDTEASLDDIRIELADGRPFNDGGKTWPGDHSEGTPCGGATTSRTLTTSGFPRVSPSPTRTGDADVKAAGLLYWCPNGNNHVMTSLNTAGYGHMDFMPTSTFDNVTEVCWDQNVTNLKGAWTEMAVVPLATFDANGQRMDYTNVQRNGDGQPGSWGLKILDGVSKFVFTNGNVRYEHDQTPVDVRSNNRNIDSTDRASRFLHCVTDNEDGTITVTSPEVVDGQIVPTDTTIAGLLPDGPVKVIWSAVAYNPDKRSGVDAYTWHWDNLTVT